VRPSSFKRLVSQANDVSPARGAKMRLLFRSGLIMSEEKPFMNGNFLFKNCLGLCLYCLAFENILM